MNQKMAMAAHFLPLGIFSAVASMRLKLDCDLLLRRLRRRKADVLDANSSVESGPAALEKSSKNVVKGKSSGSSKSGGSAPAPIISKDKPDIKSGAGGDDAGSIAALRITSGGVAGERIASGKSEKIVLDVDEIKRKLTQNLMAMRILSYTVIPILGVALLAAGIIPLLGNQSGSFAYSLQLLPVIMTLWCLLFLCMDILYLTN
jgi:hypothetical protein